MVPDPTADPASHIPTSDLAFQIARHIQRSRIPPSDLAHLIQRSISIVNPARQIAPTDNTSDPAFHMTRLIQRFI